MSALLAKSLADQPSLAVLSSSAINQDGQSSGLTAPNGPSQTRLLLSALQQAYLAPTKLRFLAVHGTGTPLGDPIEVGALGQAIRSSAATNPVAVMLGSVKSCYGHTEGAAGLTGLLMAVQCAAQTCTPPVMHLRNTNSYVEATLNEWRKSSKLEASIPKQQQAAWHAAQLAGTSSFGMSGVNAHVTVAAPDVLMADDVAATAKQLLRGQRLWPLAPVHPLVHTCQCIKEHVLFTCLVSQATVAHLWHQQVAGMPTLPAAFACELMAAAGRCTLGAAGGLSVCGATLPRPIVCKSDLAISCNVHYRTGTVQLMTAEASGELCATGGLAVVATPMRAHQQVLRPAQACWAVKSLQSAVEVAACSTAHVAALPGMTRHAYCCHPAALQATLTLGSKFEVMLGCSLYLPICHGNYTAAAPGSRAASLVDMDGTVAMHVQGLLTRSATTALAEQPAVTAFSPAWQLCWQPLDVLGLPKLAHSITALLFSTESWALNKLCSTCAPPNGGPGLVTINAVWGVGLPPAGDPSTCSELSICLEAHLSVLLNAVEVHQCIYVQPPGAAVRLEAALACYQAVARMTTKAPLSLLTYNQSLVDGAAAHPDADVGVLQGAQVGQTNTELCIPCMGRGHASLPLILHPTPPRSPYQQALPAHCSWSSGSSFLPALTCKLLQRSLQLHLLVFCALLESLVSHVAAAGCTACGCSEVLHHVQGQPDPSGALW